MLSKIRGIYDCSSLLPIRHRSELPSPNRETAHQHIPIHGAHESSRPRNPSDLTTKTLQVPQTGNTVITSPS